MATKLDINQFSRLKEKFHKLKADIFFLKKCKKHNIYPNFIRIKFSITNHITDKVNSLARKKWLLLEIKKHYATLSNMELTLYELHLKILKHLKKYEFENWLKFYNNLNQKVISSATKKKIKLIRKFKNLKNKKEKTEKRVVELVDNYIVNLSDAVFNQKDLEILIRV